MCLGAATMVTMAASVAMAESTGTADYLPIGIEVSTAATVVVEKGDHLWSISASHLEGASAKEPSAAEITPVWVEVIETNRDRLRSGDPDLIYPGETIVMP